MENLSNLNRLILADDKVSKWLENLNTTLQSATRFKGLAGSQFSFLLSAIFPLLERHVFLISADKEAAAYLYNDLQQLLKAETVLFFPDSYKRPGEYSALNRNQVMERTETINKLVGSRKRYYCVVSYPEAVLELCVNPGEIKKYQIQLVKGEKLDTDTVISILVEYGFERVDFVYEPGQFSIRGGIIDIFSFGNEWPYRIELFDDEVESLRTFDPLTQLSVARLTVVNIIPNTNTRFEANQKTPLTHVLPESTLIAVEDPSAIADRLLETFDRRLLARKNAIQEATDAESEESYLLQHTSTAVPSKLVQSLSNYPLLYYGFHNNESGLMPGETSLIEFSGSSQPAYNRNFNTLISDWKSKDKEGYKIYLFTDNKRQIERFYSIFEDLQASVVFHPVPLSIHSGFVDKNWKVAVFTDHQIFERYHRYRLRQGFTKDKALSLKLLHELSPGDFVTHIDHGIGKFSGLEKITINGNTQESVRLLYKDNDILYVSIHSLHKISKFSSQEGKVPRINKLGSEAWSNMKQKAKKKVKDIAKELIKLYAKRKSVPGFSFPPDGYLQNELEASFIYEDTPDQVKATTDVKEDMMKPVPMDRLICGDVGFGKTEVAIRAAFKAVVGGKQVAVLVPTTILALQHNKTFHERLKEFGVKVDYVNRFRTTAQKNVIYQEVKEGKVDILIGTHAILNKKVEFKDLGLLIIDEEQKFGVAAKEKLRKMAVNVDTLTLTATPIPRTLQFSLMAARDLTVIRTPPPNRQPIHTEIRVFSDTLIKEAIYYEVDRGGQVFFVHNRVQSLPDITAFVSRLCPDIAIASAHGQMEAGKLETTLIDFINKKYDVLICTNIIETGLDIPNANTMIINNAHQFGMSDLHQLRGRVGRSNRKAYCYLFAPPLSSLTRESRLRLKAMEEFADLGSGYQIAMRDLDLRGAGNLLGAEQSGFITDIGFETFQRILEEAVTELKEDEFRDLFEAELAARRVFVSDVSIESDLDMYLPDDYVSNTQERLSLYSEMDKIEDEDGLQTFRSKLLDRFGPLPDSAERMLKMLRLRWICRRIGVEQIIYKSRKLRCRFVSNPQSPFYETAVFRRITQNVLALNTRRLRFADKGNTLQLIFEPCNSIDDALELLSQLNPEDDGENIKVSAAVSPS